jgi:hypothetical protein
MVSKHNLFFSFSQIFVSFNLSYYLVLSRLHIACIIHCHCKNITCYCAWLFIDIKDIFIELFFNSFEFLSCCISLLLKDTFISIGPSLYHFFTLFLFSLFVNGNISLTLCDFILFLKNLHLVNHSIMSNDIH